VEIVGAVSGSESMSLKRLSGQPSHGCPERFVVYVRRFKEIKRAQNHPICAPPFWVR
jgi:hypothetical protein